MGEDCVDADGECMIGVGLCPLDVCSLSGVLAVFMLILAVFMLILAEGLGR